MSTRIIRKTTNGKVFFCNSCKLTHIEFKNLNFNFTEKQLAQFSKYILNLDATEWEELNEFSPFKRKIVIPISHDSFNILLDGEELMELKILVTRPHEYSGVSLLMNGLNETFRCN